MKKIYAFFLCLGLLGSAYAQSLPYKVAVVYAVPNDVTFNPQVLDTLKVMTAEMQGWYQIATGGRTFETLYPDTVITYRALQNRQYYLENGDWWGSLLSELQANAAAPIWTPGYITVIWAHGAGWWAGGAQGCGKDCGTVLVGVELLAKFNNPAYSGGECPPGQGVGAWPCTPQGALFHEFGHALGLPHPIDIAETKEVASHSIMQTHWNYPSFASPVESPWGFLTLERQTMAQNPFLKPNIDLHQLVEQADVVNLPATGPVPAAAFSYTIHGNQVRFNNKSSRAAFYYWTFGDGKVNNQASPAHVFDRPGTYKVTLRASSDAQMMDTASATITLSPGRRVAGFTLINTRSEQPIRPLRDGDELNLAALPDKLNIRADTDPAKVGSVKFELSGWQARTFLDNDAPYALFGDRKGDYNKWYPQPGSYTLTATPYSQKDGKGMAGNPLTIRFTVVDQVRPPLAAPAIEWDRTFGGNGFDFPTAIEQTQDGGYILGGSSNSSVSGDKTQDSLGNADYWVIRLDARGNKLWDKTFGGNLRDDLFALQQTRDGGYILGGWSYSSVSGDKTQDSRGGIDFWVIRLDADGNKVWDKTFGGNGWDNLFSLQQTRDGGYILGGTSYSGISGDKTQDSRGDADCWVVRIDANGNKLWDKTFGGNQRDGAASVLQTTDGGYLLGGPSNSPISGDKTQAHQGGEFDYWVVRLDANGNKLWDRTLGGGGTDNFTALQQTGDGGYILGGWSDSPISGDKTQDSRGSYDYWVVKLDAAGSKQWDKTYGSTNTDYFLSLQQTRDGGYILGGGAEESGIGGDKTEASKGSGDYWVVKLDAAGNKVWDKTIGGSFFDELTAIRQTRDEGYIMAGWSSSSISGDKTENSRGGWDYWVVKLAPEARPGQQVAGFTLINTRSEQPIRPLRDGDELNLVALPDKLNIRADTNPAKVGSVKFQLSGRQARTFLDNDAPYALFGDRKGDYNKWYPQPGSYTLTATPYARKDGKGEAGTPLTIHFTVVDHPGQVAGARLAQAALQEPAPRLRLYPNPTPDGKLQVQLSHQVQGQVRYSLLSSVGQKLAEGSLELTEAGALLEFDFSGQLRTAGVYYLKLEGADVRQVFRIMRR